MTHPNKSVGVPFQKSAFDTSSNLQKLYYSFVRVSVGYLVKVSITDSGIQFRDRFLTVIFPLFKIIFFMRFYYAVIYQQNIIVDIFNVFFYGACQ